MKAASLQIRGRYHIALGHTMQYTGRRMMQLGQTMQEASIPGAKRPRKTIAQKAIGFAIQYIFTATLYWLLFGGMLKAHKLGLGWSLLGIGLGLAIGRITKWLYRRWQDRRRIEK